MNGDGFRELVVGAPLEDDHQGAVYVFYGQGRSVQRQYKQVRGADSGRTGLTELSELTPQSPSSACGGCRLFFGRSAVFWSKSSRRVGREWGRAGRPRRGSAGSCRHRLVRPPLTDTRSPRNETSDGSRALTCLTFHRQVSRRGADSGHADLRTREDQHLQQGLSARREGSHLHVRHRLPESGLQDEDEDQKRGGCR